MQSIDVEMKQVGSVLILHARPCTDAGRIFARDFSTCRYIVPARGREQLERYLRAELEALQERLPG